MEFPLLNYIQVSREEIPLVDCLTKARLCTVENLPKFIGIWSSTDQTFDRKCAFWDGPSQKRICELIWRLNLEETQSQLNSSFHTHKLITPPKHDPNRVYCTKSGVKWRYTFPNEFQPMSVEGKESPKSHKITKKYPK